MSRKTQRGTAPVMNPQVLRNRVETALRAGQPHQAAELARTLHEIEPSPAHRELHLRASLDEARRLLAAQDFEQAGKFASNLYTLAATAEEKKQLAEILAACGNVHRSWELANQVGDAGLTARVLGHIADAAIRNRKPPSDVPADFTAHRDAILRAFEHLSAGRDEQVRDSLQLIGLSSPFLEWKLLCRGFVAYYHQDDAKALENWKRLTPERMTARLAAPFRAGIDPTVRGALTPEVRERLLKKMDWVHGSVITPALRTVKSSLADNRQLAQAFRQAESVVAELRKAAPNLVPRLAGCFFWAIIDHGNPEDLQRYARVFGAPLEDPKLCRLEALALEDRGYYQDAHDAWQSYEKNVAERSSALPAGHADRIRALVWWRMGANAAKLPELNGRRRANMSPFDMRSQSLTPLKPNAETCFKRCLGLAPDQLDAHEMLMRHYLDANKADKALAAGKKLLAKFSNHAPTLEVLGDLCMHKAEYAEAIVHFSAALKANPLDARLRLKLSNAHALKSEICALAKRFDEARAGFEAALALRDSGQRQGVLCIWAACEFLADNPERGEELLCQARENSAHPLIIAFPMLVFAIRLKLGKLLKSRFEAEVNALFAGPPDPAAAASLATQAGTLHAGGVKYVGQKTQEKKVLDYLGNCKGLEFNEGQLVSVCRGLLDLETPKLIQVYFKLGQRRFAMNPRFYLAEVDYQLTLPRSRFRPNKVASLLRKSRELALLLPQEERDAILRAVEEREEKLVELNPFARLPLGLDLEELLNTAGLDVEFEDGIDDDDWDED